MDSIANNSIAVIRAADISTAALPNLITDLRRLVTGVPRTPKFPRGGAELCQKSRFRPKVAPSGELICRARVLDAGGRCRGGLRNFCPPPTGVPASIPNTRSVYCKSSPLFVNVNN